MITQWIVWAVVTLVTFLFLEIKAIRSKQSGDTLSERTRVVFRVNTVRGAAAFASILFGFAVCFLVILFYIGRRQQLKGDRMHEQVTWKVEWTVTHRFDDGRVEVINSDGNLLMHGGASAIWECLIGNGSSLAGNELSFFDSNHAAIGVGTSRAPESPEQNNLQSANPNARARASMDDGYPQHKDGNDADATSIIFSATFPRDKANFEWNEWGIFNSSTDGQGRMLNRKVPSKSLGTKTDAAESNFRIRIRLA